MSMVTKVRYGALVLKWAKRKREREGQPHSRGCGNKRVAIHKVLFPISNVGTYSERIKIR